MPAIQDQRARKDLNGSDDRTLLRFIACGSVDDGKSTLIGRLLYESQHLYQDQLDSLREESARVGTQGDQLDFALLLDGLIAEREQGITIDVAYRFFSTASRKFIIADTPGHEQYTRNMVTAASTADAAVILVDARKGLLTQTRRHSYLVSLLGIEHVILAVNKLDLIGYDSGTFAGIETDYRGFADHLGFGSITAIPCSALKGDNVTAPSSNTPWYSGPTLIEQLEGIELEDAASGFRMPVQWVNRPDADFRGFSGQIVAGNVRVGDRLRVCPSGTETKVTRIVTFDGDLQHAVSGESVTVTLSEEVDVSRGDLLAAADDPAEVADQFEADIIWMDAVEMVPGRHYQIKLGPSSVGGHLSVPKYRIDVNSAEHLAAKTLKLNEIGVCTLTVDRAIPFDPYKHNRDMGGFIVIDRVTYATVAAGMLHFALRRSQNVHWQHVEVTKQARSAMNSHQPAAIWFTGLSGSGKSTIANLVERQLHAQGVRTYLLDGDNVRHGLNKDLGFTDADRIENMRRVTEVAKLMVDAGLVVLISFISPFREERRIAREMFDAGEFFEVFVDTPLEVAEARDRKGLYAKARAGKLKNFTGIDSPYEPPTRPDVWLRPADMTAGSCAALVADQLRASRIL